MIKENFIEIAVSDFGEEIVLLFWEEDSFDSFDLILEKNNCENERNQDE